MRNSVFLYFGLSVFWLGIFTSGKPMEESKDPLVRAFNKLDPEEKSDFIKYFVALGLKDWAESQRRAPKFFDGPDSLLKNLNVSAEKLEKYNELNIPKESRKKLLEWTKSEFGLTTKDLVEFYKSRKTIPHFPNIGDICCPW